MDGELTAALAGLEQRLGSHLADLDSRVTGQATEMRTEATQTRTDLMRRFDRIEDRVGGLDARMAACVSQFTGMIQQLTVREQSIEMLQDVLRKGFKTESDQVRSLRLTIAEMQQAWNRMQAQTDGIDETLDEQAAPVPKP